MTERPFASRVRRADLDESFPADLVDTLGPALIGESRATTATLVAVRLLDSVARAGGTRVKISAIEHAISQLERALSVDARAHCADEADRIARWCEALSGEPEVEYGNRAVMRSSDVEARIGVVLWAIDSGLDVEVEWYDEVDDRWPRQRATPLRIVDDDEPAIVLATEIAEVVIPIANLRWLMPVERRERAKRPHAARVLDFPPPTEEE